MMPKLEDCVIICREIDKSDSGKITSYLIDPPNGQLTMDYINALRLRSLLNPELTYYLLHNEIYQRDRFDVLRFFKQSSLDKILVYDQLWFIQII